MAITTYGFLKKAKPKLAIESGGTTYGGGGHGAGGEWTRILNIPQSDFVSGHTYTIAINGLLGYTYGYDALGGPNCIGSLLVVEIGIFEGPGSLWANYIHRMPVDLTTGPPWKGMEPDRTPGRPFGILARTSYPTGDIYICGRFRWKSGLARGVHFMVDSFVVDQLMVQVWDETVLTASYWKETSSSSRVEIGAAPWTDLITLTLPTGGAWIIYWGLQYSGKYDTGVVNDAGLLVRVYDTGWPKALYPASGHFELEKQHYGTNAYGTIVEAIKTPWYSHMRLLPLASAETWRLQAMGYTVPAAERPVVLYSRMVAVGLRTTQNVFEKAIAALTGDNTFYWLENEGRYYYQTATFSTAYRKRQIFLSVGNPYDLGGGKPLKRTAHGHHLEIDSGEIAREFLATDWQPIIQGAEIDAGAGDHKLLFRGSCAYHEYAKIAAWVAANPTTLGRINPRDAQIFGLQMEVDDDPPAASFETPGPELEIEPGRETGLVTGSLSALPFLPSWAIQQDLASIVRSINYPAGYKISSPKMVQIRRVFLIGWRGLPTADANTLQDFFEALPGTTGKAFRWTPPGDLVEGAFVLDPSSFARRGPNDIETMVLELIFKVTV